MTTTQNPSVRLEDSARELVSLGRLWASHGLGVASQALDASARSLDVVGRFVRTLRDELDAAEEDVAPSTDEAATTARDDVAPEPAEA